MKVTSTLLRNFIIFTLFTYSSILYSQVGINTTTPADDAMLDITATDKGMLVPRVDISDLSTIAPITGGSTESLLVYNTNATTGTGFYYWDSSQWVGLGNSDDWRELGNAGTNPATHFIGTTDNAGLRFRTNNAERLEITNDGRFLATEAGTAANPLFGWSGDSDKGFYSPGSDQFGLVTNGVERLRIPNGNQIYAMSGGNASTPFYSFNNDIDTGIWQSGADRLNIGAGGSEFLELNENGANSELVINDGGGTIDFRVETPGQSNMIFADSGSDRLGIRTNNPQNAIHIGGVSTGIRLDAFNNANNTDNNGVDVAPIYVDSNGDLTLAGPLVLNNMPEDNLTTFVTTSTPVDAIGGGPLASATLYTTSITLTQDALVEVVYQLGVNIEDYLGGTITDGAPRQYGTALFIDSNLVGYTSEAYSNSQTSGTICNGTFFLNGNGYAQLTGVAAGTTYNVSVIGFVYGADYGVRGNFGGVSGADRFQLIVHH